MLDYSSNILRLETDVFNIENGIKHIEESIYKDKLYLKIKPLLSIITFEEIKT